MGSTIRATSYAPSAEDYGKKLGKIFAHGGNADLQGLRKLTAEQIMHAYQGDAGIMTNFDALAIVDGQILPE